jgi:hypothetical protein
MTYIKQLNSICNKNIKKSIHATAIATFAETVSELALLGSLNNDKDEIRLDSLELEAGSFSSRKELCSVYVLIHFYLV